jgi:hypothetical protein
MAEAYRTFGAEIEAQMGADLRVEIVGDIGVAQRVVTTGCERAK